MRTADEGSSTVSILVGTERAWGKPLTDLVAARVGAIAAVIASFKPGLVPLRFAVMRFAAYEIWKSFTALLPKSLVSFIVV